MTLRILHHPQLLLTHNCCGCCRTWNLNKIYVVWMNLECPDISRYSTNNILVYIGKVQKQTLRVGLRWHWVLWHLACQKKAVDPRRYTTSYWMTNSIYSNDYSRYCTYTTKFFTRYYFAFNELMFPSDWWVRFIILLDKNLT